jgi:hypothetical protein
MMRKQATSLAVTYALCLSIVLVTVRGAFGVRTLASNIIPVPEIKVDGWIEGRATWYSSPWVGGCGYGHLDNYPFKSNAIAAMPDVMPEYPGSCGRCFEIKCRGIQAISADGSVNLNRMNACYDTNKTIVIKITDTCPCDGNQKWCCGDMPHFDLGLNAFARLSQPGEGIIGLYWRPIPCDAAFEGNTATQQQYDEMNNILAAGADPNVFMDGNIGIGWIKTIYGDANRAMYTYNPSLKNFSDGSVALCDSYQQYGGFDFHTGPDKSQVLTFSESKAVEFWSLTSDGVPDVAFRVANLMKGSCKNDIHLKDGVTGDTNGQWSRFYFSLSAFDCTGTVTIGDLNRIQWENRSNSNVSLCIKNIRLLPKDYSAASAGR